MYYITYYMLYIIYHTPYYTTSSPYVQILPGSSLCRSCTFTTAVNWIHVFNRLVVIRRHCFLSSHSPSMVLTVFPPCLLQQSPSPGWYDKCPIQGSTFFLLFSAIWTGISITVYFKKNLLWWELINSLVYEYNDKLLVSLIFYPLNSKSSSFSFWVFDVSRHEFWSQWWCWG